jgi:hypothetical protein
MQPGTGAGPSSDFSAFHRGFSSRNAEDIFRQFFGGRDPFADFFDDEDDIFGGRGFGRGFGM